ncbi:SDR family oxidoreductase [Streptomyces sp. HNM0575]|uniref:SDR family NAD(P)-dependent oxidoreductase n=1 Tax=Streptomyces sp. HNM0575 TaxID=2716338 RepID=UPI00145E476F|nr:SDR family NAD(P)-dependent oxidoreductase [Streptomyces sp. HNM0575]NLU76141.1 SDR family oxidoreductase [Streptomyces sp. HNM0575]
MSGTRTGGGAGPAGGDDGTGSAHPADAAHSPRGRLAGRTAVVTGAGCVGSGWGNGRAAAVLFAREGATVLAVDVDEEALEATVALVRDQRSASADRPAHRQGEQEQGEADGGGRIHPYVCDVTDSAAVSAMAEHCRRELGGPDVLVNNVGGSRHGGPAELAEDDWHSQLDLNLTSVYLTCRHIVPLMRERGGGSIVNTASTSGLRWTGSPQIGYASAKAGVIQFSRVAAVQHAPDGIRVNTVVPGQLHTPMVEARLAGQRAGGDAAALLAQREARIPLGFMGDGRDTAYAALFLASDEARFVTGTEIVVDGGMTARCD